MAAFAVTRGVNPESLRILSFFALVLRNGPDVYFIPPVVSRSVPGSQVRPSKDQPFSIPIFPPPFSRFTLHSLGPWDVIGVLSFFLPSYPSGSP